MVTDEQATHITTGIAEIIGDYVQHGFSHSDIRPIIKTFIIEYCQQQNVTLNRVDWQMIARSMEGHIECGEGWTFDDVAMLKSMFKAHQVDFNPTISEDNDDEFEW